MIEILSLLLAAVAATLIFSRLGMGSVLGYLAGGIVIGPSGLGLITDAENLRHIGEFGVVFLLFLVGTEIKPQRLWVMRRLVFGTGGLQVVVTGIILAVIAYHALGLKLDAAMVIGYGFALSSTAFCVQLLAERNQLTSHWGRSSFAVLLFQDLAVVPLLALVPLLAVGHLGSSASIAIAVLEALGIFIGILLAGRHAIGPLLHLIAKSRSSDAMVAVALLLVLGFGWLTDLAGLSMAMGAFIAGVLLADSQYRHQIEADIVPFRGLLLGLFFMSVGMSLSFSSVIEHAEIVIYGTAILLSVKAILIICAAIAMRTPIAVAIRTGFLLSQAGEFSFVLFSLADAQGLLPDGLMEPLVSIVILSMAATPIMMRLGDRIGTRLSATPTNAPPMQEIEADHPVLIAGFGRVGETVTSMLEMAGVPSVAIDIDADNVAKGRRNGFTVYYGDAGRAEVLRAVGADRARLLVVTIDDPASADKMVRTVRLHYPNLAVHVRAHDWEAADRFTSLGARHAMPETVEASLRIGAAALEGAGVGPDERRALFEKLSADDFAHMRELNAPNRI
ncbi:MAG: cation:proton antiporter [Rhodospirillales bacterium]|nr:cation:proton antiporter [Rhodospirillales bacterium]